MTRVGAHGGIRLTEVSLKTKSLRLHTVPAGIF